MAIAAKKVSHNVGVVIRLLLLLFSAASFSVHAHARTMGNVGVITQSPPWDDRKLEAYWKFYLNFEGLQDGRKYRTYSVMLRKRPDGEAMDNDDKDARRRWYESFLPSTPTDSGEPRLVDCYPLDINGFLATLTRAEALALANKPGVVRRMLSLDHLGPYSYSPASCGFVTAITKRNVVRSRPAL